MDATAQLDATAQVPIVSINRIELAESRVIYNIYYKYTSTVYTNKKKITSFRGRKWALVRGEECARWERCRGDSVGENEAELV